MAERRADKLRRIDDAHDLIRIIGSCGRRFLWNECHNRYARFELDAKGRLWFFDDYIDRPIYTAYRGRWRHFSHGGTMRRLVDALACYIRTEEPISPYHFGPWPDNVCGGDLWGYGDDMKHVRWAAEDSLCVGSRMVAA